MSAVTMGRVDSRVLVAEDALRTHDAYEQLGVGRRLLLRMIAPRFTSVAARTGRAAQDAYGVPEQPRFDARKASSWMGLGS